MTLLKRITLCVIACAVFFIFVACGEIQGEELDNQDNSTVVTIATDTEQNIVDGTVGVEDDVTTEIDEGVVEDGSEGTSDATLPESGDNADTPLPKKDDNTSDDNSKQENDSPDKEADAKSDG